MLEWVCPGCGRDVDPGLRVCPFCGAAEAAAPEAKTPEPEARVKTQPRISNLEFLGRCCLGLVGLVALVYTVVLMIAFWRGNDEMVNTMLRWIHAS